MDLISIRELYKKKEEYLDKKITVGGWVRSIRDSKAFGFIVVNDGTFLNHYRLCTTIQWTILQRYPS